MRKYKGPRRPVVILIPEEDYWQLKDLTIKLRMTLQDLVVKALREYHGIGFEELEATKPKADAKECV